MARRTAPRLRRVYLPVTARPDPPVLSMAGTATHYRELHGVQVKTPRFGRSRSGFWNTSARPPRGACPAWPALGNPPQHHGNTGQRQRRSGQTGLARPICAASKRSSHQGHGRTSGRCRLPPGPMDPSARRRRASGHRQQGGDGGRHRARACSARPLAGRTLPRRSLPRAWLPSGGGHAGTADGLHHRDGNGGWPRHGAQPDGLGHAGQPGFAHAGTPARTKPWPCTWWPGDCAATARSAAAVP